jgi:hypothetical protein
VDIRGSGRDALGDSGAAGYAPPDRPFLDSLCSRNNPAGANARSGQGRRLCRGPAGPEVNLRAPRG